MEYIKRIFTDNSKPLEYESSLLQDVDVSLRPMLVARKSRLTFVLVLITLSWLSNIILTYTTDTPTNIKFLAIGAVIIDAAVIVNLFTARKLWCYPSNTVTLGSVALVIDSLKLIMLLIPYFNAFSNFMDLLPAMNLILAWYVPYLLIFLIIRNKLYYLSNIKAELLNTWTLTNIIYVPIVTLIYGIIINITPIYLYFAHLPIGLISIVYMLYVLSMLTIFAMYKKYNVVANVLSVIWVLLLLIAVYEISDSLYDVLVSTYVTSFFNSMKLSILCQDAISYVYNVTEIQPDIELTNSIRIHTQSYTNLDGEI